MIAVLRRRRRWTLVPPSLLSSSSSSSLFSSAASSSSSLSFEKLTRKLLTAEKARKNIPLEEVSSLFRDFTSLSTHDTNEKKVSSLFHRLNHLLLLSLNSQQESDVERKKEYDCLGDIIGAVVSSPETMWSLPGSRSHSLHILSDHLLRVSSTTSSSSSSSSSSVASSSSSSLTEVSSLSLLDEEDGVSSDGVGKSITRCALSSHQIGRIMNELRGVELSAAVVKEENEEEEERAVGQEVLGLLGVLSDMIRQEERLLSPPDIATSLSALSNKSSDLREVRMMFGSVIGHIHPDDKDQLFSNEEIRDCVRGIGNMDDSHKVIVKGVKKFAALIGREDSDGTPWTLKEVSDVLVNLGGMTTESREVRSFLKNILKRLQEAPSDEGGSPLLPLSMGLTGLKSMSSQSYEVKQLLYSITKRLRECSMEEVNSDEDAVLLGNCLTGMQNMAIHHAEVYSLCDALTKKFRVPPNRSIAHRSCVDFNDPSTLVCLVRPISNFSSDYRATAKLFRLIAERHQMAFDEMGTTELSGKHLILMLSGLKNSSNQERHVKFFLNTILRSTKLIQHDQSVSAYAVSNAMIGLRGMANYGKGSAAVDAICQTLCSVLLKIQDQNRIQASDANSYRFNNKNVSVALQGLQGMKSCTHSSTHEGNDCCEPPAVVSLVETFYDTLRKQDSGNGTEVLSTVREMSLSDCTRALYGLLHIHHEASDRVLLLKEQLLEKSRENLFFKYGDKKRNHMKDISNVSEILELQRVLQLHSFVYSEEIKQPCNFLHSVAVLGKWVNQFVANSAVIVKESEHSDNSVLERRLRGAFTKELTAALKVIGTFDVTLQTNINIEGFDVDMLVKVQRGGVMYIYNLEIDGPHHRKPHKERFAQLRDSFLLKKGHINDIRRLTLFGEDPRKTKIINKNWRERVVKSEVNNFASAVKTFFTLNSS